MDIDSVESMNVDIDCFINNEPDIFENNMHPLNLRCRYGHSAQALINGRRHTFGHVQYPAWSFGPRRVTASIDMVRFETRIIENANRQYNGCEITNIIIVAASAIFGHIFGGLNNIPPILMALYGRTGIFAFPEINGHESADFHTGRYAGRSYNINAIHGVTFDRTRRLWALYQIDYLDRYGRLFTNVNDPNSFTWDYIGLRIFDLWREPTLVLLDEFWKWKMVEFVVNNHFYRFSF